ncbi:MAG: ABC transporter permease subunit [Spirochaetes bacterium]|nr:ABC transporter permease subunit [Spirochaetota bacterium]
MTKTISKVARNALGILLVLGIWKGAATLVASSLVLPSPGEVFAASISLAAKGGFWLAVGGSCLRVTSAFLVSLCLGIISGVLSALFPAFEDILAPILTIIRATPVLALILIAMFWLPTGVVPIFSAFLMAFPVVHTSSRAGMLSLDPELLEMAMVFMVPAKERLLKLRLPAAKHHILAGAKNALGLCWKVVVAGEVLAQPRRALGTGLQDQRLSIDTAGVFAWAIATVIFCGLSEYCLGLLVKRTGRTALEERS